MHAPAAMNMIRRKAIPRTALPPELPELGDPDAGVKPGTSFDDIPEDWVCPVCGLGKDMFEEA